jgi:hypothetical protein
MYHDFSNAKKFITNCTEVNQMKDYFLGRDTKPYFDDYTEKYNPQKRKSPSTKTYNDVYISIKSKQDVINRQNYTEQMITEYQIKFDRGDCNKGSLETAIGSIEIGFSEYIIALRKLITINSREYKCSVEEAKSFILASFEYHEKIYQLKFNIGMWD